MASNSAGIGGLLPPVVTADSGKILTTDGQLASWEVSSSALPSQGGNNGKFLTTDGTSASWASVSASISVGTFGSTPNADAMSFAAGVLTGQPADATHPGFITAGTQAIGGAKTLSGALTLTAGLGVSGAPVASVQVALGTSGGLSGLWFNATTPGLTNYALLAFTGATFINSNTGQDTLVRCNNVTIATFASAGNLTIANGNTEVLTVGNSFVLKSPDGTRWKLVVANTTGALTASLA